MVECGINWEEECQTDNEYKIIENKVRQSAKTKLIMHFIFKHLALWPGQKVLHIHSFSLS